MKSNNKAKTPNQYLNALAVPRQNELKYLDKFIQKKTKLKPFMLAGMLSYGPFHYKYASGREGDWAAIMLASQKNYISLYLCIVDGATYVPEKYKKLLPKASIGKSCIRFKKFADLDSKILETMLKNSVKIYKDKYKKK